MPSPFAQVVWVPGERLTRGSQLHRQKIARELLDTHEEAFPRSAGRVGERYRVESFERLRAAWRDDGTPLVVSVDLDYFAAVSDAALPAAFEQLWDWIGQRPALVAVTFALSRPWLRDDAQAHRLAELALRGALSLPTAAVQFEPFRDAGPDRSMRARELRAAGQSIPRWDLDAAPESLRGRLLAARHRLRVTHEVARWEELLARWQQAAAPPVPSVRDGRPSVDGIWRVPVAESAVLCIDPPLPAGVEIEWLALTPQHPRVNLLARDANWTGFAAGAAPRPRWHERRVGTGRDLPLAEVREVFDPASGCGSGRFVARVRLPNGVQRESEPIEVRRFSGERLHAALTEQFALPYLLGGSALRVDGRSGPECGLGADCGNFVVAALRATGRLVPWSDPKQLREHLRMVGRAQRAGAVRFTAAQLRAGLIVHLGSHVAAVLEDRPPLGVLDASDLLAHQLEGPAAMLTLGALLRQRGAEVFDLYTADEPPGERLLVGGDVMLGRSLAPAVAAGENVLAGLSPLLRDAAAVALNLEGVPALSGEPMAGRKFCLRAPPNAGEALQAAGVRVVGLANNHADDFGDAGLAEALDRLRGTGLRVVGAGENAAAACAPAILTTAAGVRIAFVAVCAVPAEPTGLRALRLALATDRPAVAEALSQARREADVVIALAHWGLEGVEEPSEAQTELARWLARSGADAIVGAGPHRVQPLEMLAGVPVAFSLGNLVFDGAPQVAWWNAGALLELHVSSGGRLTSARLLPVQLREGRPFSAASAVPR
ncbi:MAG: CapA family protein [Verrucomicrobia bacterium]|nr:CapA family protein [Verrucomicrobiota bacterium]